MPRFKHEEENNWISISDIMTGLMVIFMFLAISYIIKVQKSQKVIIQIAGKLEIPLDSISDYFQDITDQKESIIRIIAEYKNEKDALYKVLNENFEKDFKKWNVTLDKETLTIRFNGKGTKFEGKSDRLRSTFIEQLNIFIPKYLSIINNEKYKNIIEEIRIEGHAFDSESATFDGATYISQKRASKVLYHLIRHPSFTKLGKKRKTELEFKLVACGMGYGRMIDKNGQFIIKSGQKPCADCSRRVEFKIVTKTEKVLYSIDEHLK